MKGLRGKVIAGVMAALGIAVAALITYVVENGVLPAWLLGLVAWCINFALFEVPVPVWAAFSFLFLLAMGLYIIVRVYEKESSENGAYTDKREAEYYKLKSYCETLKKTNSELKSMNATLAAEHGKLNATNSELISESVELKSVNAQLNHKVSVMLQAEKTEALSVDNLNQEQLSVFDYIGGVLDSGSSVHVSTVMRGLRISVLTAEDILDSLCELKVIERYSSLVEADSFALTPAGRSCYLKRMRNTPLNPGPRHG